MKLQRAGLLFCGAIIVLFAGCFGRSSGGPNAGIPAGYAALPDTLVCVLDRAMPLGLREIPAKKQGAEVVVVIDGAIAPLSSAHPVNVIAGYAGREAWLTQGEPLPFEGGTFARSGGERRVEPSLLRRAGEYRGILLFAGATDTAPAEAVYVPTSPGCIFQPYVRNR